MSRAKELLEQATPLPWTIRKGPHDSSPTWVEAPEHVRYPDDSGPRIIFMLSDLHADTATPDAALIAYAVNRLPDYEAAVEALDAMLDMHCNLHPHQPCGLPEHDKYRALVARLRDEVPA